MFVVLVAFHFQVSVKGSATASCYVSTETTLLPYVEVHQMLEARREEAARTLRAAAPADGVGGGGDGAASASTASSASAASAAAPSARGPRVIVAGPVDSGKSTLVKSLVAYACRMGWSPVVADCDLGQVRLIVYPSTVDLSSPLIDYPSIVYECVCVRLCLHVCVFVRFRVTLAYRVPWLRHPWIGSACRWWMA